MLIKRIILYIGVFIMWLILSWSADIEHIIAGIIVSGVVVLATGGIFSDDPFQFKGVDRLFRFFFYFIPVFIWECARANIDVAYRVLHPSLPIKPGIVRVKMNLKSRIAITFLANCITLTPGTLVIDVDTKNGYMYVHWIYVKTQDLGEATIHIIERYERILKGIFE